MSELISKRFCPLLSSENKKAFCNENCMWHVENDDCSGMTCAVPLSLLTGGALLAAIEKRPKK